MKAFIKRGGRTYVALAAMLVSACTPEPTMMDPVVDSDVRYAAAVKFWENNAAVHFNDVARDLVATTLASTPFAIRGYAIMSIAQYHAAVTAAKGRAGSMHPSVHAAISAASTVVLSYLFPARAAELEAQLEAYLAQPGWPGERHTDAASGIAIGRAAAQAMVERAMTDNFFAPWTGTVPVGPGMWFSSTVPPSPPAGAAFGQARTFLLASADQFRPAPPPAFGSPAFTAALAEVRSFSDNRTPAQDSIAKFWHLPPGTHAPPGYWNEEATKLAVKYRLGERETAHVLALTNIVMYDGLLASHEAKYTYWLLRPNQADPGITLSVGLPNFPAYPSNHAAISAAAAKILGRAFPAERNRLTALAEEAALSRVMGGIHYRFDGDAGLTLGRRVADWVIAHDVNGQQPFTLR
jgi:membrane-associated phospholipid phosphatase